MHVDNTANTLHHVLGCRSPMELCCPLTGKILARRRLSVHPPPAWKPKSMPPPLPAPPPHPPPPAHVPVLPATAIASDVQEAPPSSSIGSSPKQPALSNYYIAVLVYCHIDTLHCCTHPLMCVLQVWKGMINSNEWRHPTHAEVMDHKLYRHCLRRFKQPCCILLLYSLFGFHACTTYISC